MEEQYLFQLNIYIAIYSSLSMSQKKKRGSVNADTSAEDQGVVDLKKVQKLKTNIRLDKVASKEETDLLLEDVIFLLKILHNQQIPLPQ